LKLKIIENVGEGDFASGMNLFVISSQVLTLNNGKDKEKN